MSDAIDPKDESFENNSPILAPTLRVINSLESEGIIGRYAIGAGIGLMFFCQPFSEWWLEIFCAEQPSGVNDFNELAVHLVKMGCEQNEESILIEGVPVKFYLPPRNALIVEALAESLDRTCEGVSTRVFQYEHSLAICAQTGTKYGGFKNPLVSESALYDGLRICLALESAPGNRERLEDILRRHHVSLQGNYEEYFKDEIETAPNDPNAEAYRQKAYRQKALRRRDNAELPIEVKLQSLFRNQCLNYEFAKAGFKTGARRLPPPIPWGPRINDN